MAAPLHRLARRYFEGCVRVSAPTQPSTDRRGPCHVNIIELMRQLNGSVDLWSQVNLRTGERTGHSPQSCREVPNWLQMAKLSGLPLISVISLGQMHLYAGLDDDDEAHCLIDELSAVVDALSDVDHESRYGTRNLSQDECSIVAAANALVEAGPIDAAAINATLALLAASYSKDCPRPSLKVVLQAHRQTRLLALRKIEQKATGRTEF